MYVIKCSTTSIVCTTRLHREGGEVQADIKRIAVGDSDKAPAAVVYAEPRV